MIDNSDKFKNIDFVRYKKLLDPTKSYKDELPYYLTWSDVDPKSHKFDKDFAKEQINQLLSKGTDLDISNLVTYNETKDTEYVHLNRSMQSDWSQLLTHKLVEMYGNWALGWRYSSSEGDVGGGPVKSWCCASHSIKSPDLTVKAVIDSLVEWREWLEKLSGIFDKYEDGVINDERRWTIFISEIITEVMEATEVSDAWYGHAIQVLEWALQSKGISVEESKIIVKESLDGKWESWNAISEDQVENTASSIANKVVSNDNK